MILKGFSPSHATAGINSCARVHNDNNESSLMVGAVANSPTNWKAFTKQSEVPTWCQLFYKPHASGVNLIRGGLEIHIRADIQMIGGLSVGRFASTLEAIEANYTNSLGK